MKAYFRCRDPSLTSVANMAANLAHPSSRTTTRQERPTDVPTARYWGGGSATRNKAEARVSAHLMRVHLLYANPVERAIMCFGQDHPNDVRNLFWPQVPSSASSTH